MKRCGTSPAFASSLLTRPPPASCDGASPRVCLRHSLVGHRTSAVAAKPPPRRRRFTSSGVHMAAAADDGRATPDGSPSSPSPPASGDDADAIAAGAEVDVPPNVDAAMDAEAAAAAAARASEAELREALLGIAKDADQARSDQEALTEERLFILKMKREMHPDDWRRIFDPKNRRIGDFM